MTHLALVGDVGGTNARFALADLDTLAISDFANLKTCDHASLADAMRVFLSSCGTQVAEAAIAVAGPVTGDAFAFTNLGWSFRQSELARDLALSRLVVLNDFEALALSLPHLPGADLVQIGGGEPEPGRMKAVVGPGTGLGVGGVMPAGGGWVALPGEGGHVALAAEDAEEFAIIEAIRPDGGRVSAERALCGPGLEALYQAIGARRGKSRPMSAADITAAALDETDAVAVEAMETFVLWLGRFAGDVALLMGAKGGLYLGGGIPPRVRKVIEKGAFRAGFDAKGRLSHFVEPIPVYLILAGDAPLRGAAAGLKAANAS